MRCPKCGSPTTVRTTRYIGARNERWRYCTNPTCGARMTSFERIDMTSIRMPGDSKGSHSFGGVK